MPKTSKKEAVTDETPAAANGSAPATEAGTPPAKKRAAKSAKTSSAKKSAPKKKTAAGAAKKTSAKRAEKSDLPEPTDSEIRMRAYFIAERRVQMGLEGDSATDWLQARQELIDEARQARS